MTKRDEELQYIRAVFQEASRLLDQDELFVVPAGAYDAILQAMEAGENADDVARQLVDDGVFS